MAMPRDILRLYKSTFQILFILILTRAFFHGRAFYTGRQLRSAMLTLTVMNSRHFFFLSSFILYSAFIV